MEPYLGVISSKKMYIKFKKAQNLRSFLSFHSNKFLKLQWKLVY